MKKNSYIQSVKVKVSATTGRDEAIDFEFQVDGNAPKAELHEAILNICNVADHRRGIRNDNFIVYQRLLGNLGPEISEAARSAIDFLYGSHMGGFEPEMPQLAPIVEQAVRNALEANAKQRAALDALEGE